MKHVLLFIALGLGSLGRVAAEDKLWANPVTAQFQKHLDVADANKDGKVTQEELAIEIGKERGRPPDSVKPIVASMLKDLDANGDGTLSGTEVREGARRAGEHYASKVNSQRAGQLMQVLSDYKKKQGAWPAKLEELVKLKLIDDSALQCIVDPGTEKPWTYAGFGGFPNDANAVVICSPGKVDTTGQYMVGLADGRVLGLDGADLDLEKLPRLKMSVIPDKKKQE